MSVFSFLSCLFAVLGVVFAPPLAIADGTGDLVRSNSTAPGQRQVVIIPNPDLLQKVREAVGPDENGNAAVFQRISGQFVKGKRVVGYRIWMGFVVSGSNQVACPYDVRFTDGSDIAAEPAPDVSCE